MIFIRAITVLIAAFATLAGALAIVAYFGNNDYEQTQIAVTGLAAAFLLIAILMALVNVLSQVEVMSSKLDNIEAYLAQMDYRDQEMAKWQVAQSKRENQRG